MRSENSLLQLHAGNRLIRTDLQYPWPDGTSSLYYDRIRFAYFDIKILEREGAEKDYTEEELHKVAELDKADYRDRKG